FKINGGMLHERPDGTLVLSGTVSDSRVRDSIEQRVSQIRQQGVGATLDLRSGDKIAADVSEVLRTQSLNAKTRYLGNGVVEVSGSFEDTEALAKAARSRAMSEVPGVKRVYVKNYVPDEGDGRVARTGGKAAPVEPTRIVKVVRGKDDHLVAMDGTEDRTGDAGPGVGKLVWVGEHVQVMDAEGMLHRVKARPVTADELAAAAEQAAADVPPGDAPATGNQATDKATTATTTTTATAGTAADRRVALADKDDKGNGNK